MWLKKLVGVSLVITIISMFGITIGGLGFTRSDKVMVLNPDGTTKEISAEEAAANPNLVEVTPAKSGGGSSSGSTSSAVSSSGGTSSGGSSSSSSSSSGSTASASSGSTSSTGGGTTTSGGTTGGTSGGTTTGGGTTVSAPVVSLSISPSSITSGSSSTLSWSATNSPTSCSASGSWSGTKSSSGSQSTGTKTTGTYTYTLTCSNSGGSGSKDVTQTVSAPALACGSGGTCHYSDISSHTSQSDCRGATNADGSGLKTYSYTSSFITSHAAYKSASTVVNRLCGKEYSSNLRNFTGSHKGPTISGKSYDTWMSNFYIGPYSH